MTTEPGKHKAIRRKETKSFVSKSCTGLERYAPYQAVPVTTMALTKTEQTVAISTLVAALLSKRLPLCTTRLQSFCHTLAPFSAWLSRK